MTVVVAVFAGFFVGRLLWLALRKGWQRQVFLRKNFQGVTLPTAAGVVLPLALLVVEAGRAVSAAFGLGDDPSITPVRAAVLVAVCGFALLGLLDDLAGNNARGFTGHMRALTRGELTSGGIKMLGGVVIALTVAAFIGSDGVNLLVDAAIVALAANLANLFDLRPGRTTKVGLFAFVMIAAIAALDAVLVPVAIVVGAAGALMLDDLKERLMIGDTGANALGAVVGVAIVTQAGEGASFIALGVLLAFNVASEFVSFTKVIDSVAPLRALDLLGRRRSSTVDVRDDPPADDPPMPPMRDSMSGARESDLSEPR